MAGEVERNEELEQQRQSRISAGKVAQKTSGSATVGHHVQDSSELGRLSKSTRGLTVHSIQKT